MKLKATIPLNDIKPNIYDVKEYDNELDDGRSVIADICEIFADTEKIQFIVSGFGDRQWPVDCRFDLPVIIEQLPEIISKIKNNDFNFILDFYEQGIEREINFEGDKDSVSLECISRNSWIPEPSKIVMEKGEVNKIFNMLYEDFLSYSKILCNDLANHYLLKEWMNI
jgi:hypothetical protein